VTIAMIVHFHKRNLPAGPRALISSVVKKGSHTLPSQTVSVSTHHDCLTEGEGS